MIEKTNLIKGQKGYYKIQKRKELLLTVLFFGIVLAVFLAGILTVKSRLNVMTVVAIVGVLPASKKALFFFMICKKKECSESRYAKICAHQGSVPGIFELLITSPKKAHPIDAIHVRGGEMIVLTHDEKCDIKDFLELVTGILKNNHLEKVHVKVFTKDNPYLERLEYFNQTVGKEGEETSDILRLMLAISV